LRDETFKNKKDVGGNYIADTYALSTVIDNVSKQNAFSRPIFSVKARDSLTIGK